MSRLTLYHRPDCSLCAAMRDELAPLQAQYGFELELVDIDRDPALVACYNERVPVLAANDTVLCQYFLDPDVVEAYFADS